MINIDIRLVRKNFEIAINESFPDGITGIYGPSGSGKTSLLQSVAGLAHPRHGKITVGGRTLLDTHKHIHLPVEKRNIGYVFQEGRLFPHMTIEKNLRYGLKKNGHNKVQFDEVVYLLKLTPLLKSKPAHISGGERQRTALGRSLLSSPDLLLLDEPFSAVDVRHRSQIIPFLLQIHQKTHIPILVVSHDLPDLLKLSNRICVIKNGKCLGNDDYFNLLKFDEILTIFGESEIVNSVQLHVETIDYKSGLTVLWDGATNNRVKVKTNIDKTAYKVGEPLNFFLSAEDIALSVEKPQGLTIQNQLLGTVVDTVQMGASTLCRIDVGFYLTAEITTHSQQRMQIEPGRQVWCLFKSVAIDVAG